MMRSLVAAVALASLLLPLPMVLAQTAGDPVQVLEDKAGDVNMVLAGNSAGNPSGRFTANDLVGLSVDESETAFIFHLKVASLDTSPEAPVESSLYTVGFSHGQQAYRLLFWRMVSQSANYGAQLQVYDSGRDDYGGGQRLAVTASGSDDTMTVEVPREQLLDEMGAAPFPTRVLSGFHAQAMGLSQPDNDGICIGVVPCQPAPETAVLDAMPDQGVGIVDVPVRIGLKQDGYARLFAATPVRTSNGEATTFVFQVMAQNTDTAMHRFALATSGVPMAWQVHLPSDIIEIGANKTQLLPVLVATPFGHNHGTFQDFLLEMTSLDDGGSVGRVQLGVRYTATPQPAGHHNLLYLHTAELTGDATFSDAFGTLFGFDPQHLYFNTLTPDEDENDDKTPVGGSPATGFFNPASPDTNRLTRGKYTWTIPLSPPLGMGMDFDLANPGSIRITLDAILPLPGAVLEGRIIHNIPVQQCDPRRDNDCEYESSDDYRIGMGTRTTAAVIGPSSAVEVGPNAVGVAFEAPIVATPEGDYLPFAPGATLTMQLNITFARPDTQFGPKDLPKISGGSMTMPLLEYHDAVDTVFASSAGLMMEVEGEQQRQVNAGETAVFDLILMNHADKTSDYVLELSGPNMAWGDILGDARVSIQPGETRPLAIAVKAPSSAKQGDLADLVITAIHTADPSQRTLARLVVLVDESMDHPDDSARVKALDGQLTDKKSPGLEAVASLAVLALAVLVRRRRA